MKNRSLRIFFFTQNELLYLPLFFDIFLKNTKDIVSGIVITSPASTKGWRDILKTYFYLGSWTGFFWIFLVQFFLNILDVITRVLPLKHSLTFSGIARKYRIGHIKRVKNINSKSFISFMKNKRPDIIVSVACGQIFKKELLQVPSYGAINIHSSLLPKYRGMLPSFWALYHNEKHSGITVHFMDEKIDQGRIIVQERFSIEGVKTMHWLIRYSKAKGALVLLKALERLRNTPKKEKYPVMGKGRYYSLPSKKEIEEFRAMGKRLR